MHWRYENRHIPSHLWTAYQLDWLVLMRPLAGLDVVNVVSFACLCCLKHTEKPQSESKESIPGFVSGSYSFG